MTESQTVHWRPLKYFRGLEEICPMKYVLVMLNQPVINSDLLVRLWNGAQFRVAVDGGASIWHRMLNNTEHKIVQEHPDMITGDFDSVDLSNVEHFKSLGSRVVATPDQDYTDFTKCLKEVGGCIATGELASLEAVLAFVENSGRLDQIMANIETLFLGETILPGIPIYLVSSHTITCLLQAGNHCIRFDGTDMSKVHCGLIPIAGKARVTTSGLKWNLSEDDLMFGRLVSTSNGIAPAMGEVRITTDAPLLWTMDIPDDQS